MNQQPNLERHELPNYDSVRKSRAGRLLDRLQQSLYLDVHPTARKFIYTLSDRFSELQNQVEGNTNDGHLLSGLITEQEQILQELEDYVIKCLRQHTKEQNEAKKGKSHK